MPIIVQIYLKKKLPLSPFKPSKPIAPLYPGSPGNPISNNFNILEIIDNYYNSKILLIIYFIILLYFTKIFKYLVLQCHRECHLIHVVPYYLVYQAYQVIREVLLFLDNYKKN